MKAYLDVLKEVVDTGILENNRTGVKAKSVFALNFKHDLADGFPLLTTKKINPRQVFGEMFAFLTGATNTEDFRKFGCTIWDAWGLKKDYVNVVRNDTDELIKQLAEYDGVTVEEVKSVLDDLAVKRAKWEEEKITIVEELSKVEEFDAEKYGNAMADHMAKQPQSFHDILRDRGIKLSHQDVLFHKGELGPIYGKKWLEWRAQNGQTINQIKNIAETLNTDRTSRRMVVTGWDPEDVPANRYVKNPITDVAVTNSDESVQAAILSGKQALPPCHLMFILQTQWREGDVVPRLNLNLIMRSTDVPIGLPFNIASYALLLMLIAKSHGMDPGVLAINMTDCHVYEDQLELAAMQLTREPGELPTLTIPDGIHYDQPETLTPENLDRLLEGLTGYEPQAFIKYPTAV